MIDVDKSKNDTSWIAKNYDKIHKWILNTYDNEELYSPNTLRNHLENQVSKVSKKLQLKFEHLQNGSIEADCDEIGSEKREFFYDLDNVNAVGCGLGC